MAQIAAPCPNKEKCFLCLIKSLFKAFECPFKAFECAFRAFECRFKAFEQTFQTMERKFNQRDRTNHNELKTICIVFK